MANVMRIEVDTLGRPYISGLMAGGASRKSVDEFFDKVTMPTGLSGLQIQSLASSVNPLYTLDYMAQQMLDQVNTVLRVPIRCVQSSAAETQYALAADTIQLVGSWCVIGCEIETLVAWGGTTAELSIEIGKTGGGTITVADAEDIKSVGRSLVTITPEAMGFDPTFTVTVDVDTPTAATGETVVYLLISASNVATLSETA